MDDAKQELANKLKSANNILVTVSRDPSVDQLAGCIGLTLLLNKLGKHTAAVFSGEIPSTLEFLQPEDTLEKNTDSLRDFIIALDKSKADKLRYKVEDNLVRIFITPYKTSISQADLDFSQGDFNVDVVVALGVAQQEDMDEAITAHGRILHDATVTSINTSTDGGLGSINWNDPQTSSLSELVTELAQLLEPNILDAQIATALLTGIVSETGRFSNDKTSSHTMSISAALMTAGANQQLVASKLEQPDKPASSLGLDEESSDTGPSDNPGSDDTPSNTDGTIELNHDEEAKVPAKDSDQPPPGDMSADDTTSSSDSKPDDNSASSEKTKPAPKKKKASKPDNSDDTSTLSVPDEIPSADKPDDLSSDSDMSPGSKLVTEPPSMGGTLTANSGEEKLDPVTDPFSLPASDHPKMLERTNDTLVPTPTPLEVAAPAPTPLPPPKALPTDEPEASADRLDAAHDPSLIELEEAAKSPAAKSAELEDVRDDIDRALTTSVATSHEQPEPIDALNARPLGEDLHPTELLESDMTLGPPPDLASLNSPMPLLVDPVLTPSDPSPSIPSEPSATDSISADSVSDPPVIDSNAPPPVPPPIPFQFGNPPPAQ